MTNHRIVICLIFDCIYSGALMLYVIFCFIRLIVFAWKYSRLEAREHMWYFMVVSASLGFSLPLVINNLLMFMHKAALYGDIRFVYYSDCIAKTLPCAVYLLMKPSEDCFTCFNRLAPQTYSVLQYSREELTLSHRLSPSSGRKILIRPAILINFSNRNGSQRLI